MSTALWAGLAVKNQWGATAANRVDWVGDTIKVALTTSSYSFDQDTHDMFDDVTNEVSGTGYTAGGATLASKTLTYDSPTNKIVLDSADPQWTGATITAIRKAVVYKSTGVSSTSPLIAVHTFAADQAVSSGTFTIAVDADGWARAVVS